jgi:CO/xanthine dehydrogenase Mo-binding subunit
MNAMLDAAMPTRRDLIKGGALIVGFALTGLPAARAATGIAPNPPDPSLIDSWIAVHADNTATVFLGKCELGQGSTTGLLQIAGEELDVDMSHSGPCGSTPMCRPTRAPPHQVRRSSVAGRKCAPRPPRRARRCWRSPRRG